MRRDYVRRHIVGRMLDRRECIDIFPERQNYDSSRMLSGTAPDTRAPLQQAFDLAVSLCCSLALKEVFYVTVCSFFRNRSDGSGFKCLLMAEDHLRVGVCLTLVFSGEVKVDIRLFIPLESEESLEGNIKAVFFHRFAAFRADPGRQIDSAAPGISLNFR